MGGIILVASIVIWALGYFPRNSEIAEQFDIQIAAIQQTTDLSSENSLQRDSVISELIYQKKSVLQQKSFIGQIGRFIEPAMAPLGFDWKMSVSLLAGIAAKEVVVSTMGVLFMADAEPDNVSETLVSKLRNSRHTEGVKKGENIFNPISAFSYLMFILLYFPCVAVVAAIRKESGTWKWAAFLVFYTTAIAWLVAFGVYQVGIQLFG
jgi:ferrous iron transport protein B